MTSTPHELDQDPDAQQDADVDPDAKPTADDPVPGSGAEDPSDPA
ncbi:MAG TPA: hypothetical protein VHW64_04200 [Nocardioides sp.]|jgi:hypothetical protein|nr:hypothetical protein [Nocardioides sp.]HEX3929879.1 hypothetical protein [Nocardioides sp.]